MANLFWTQLPPFGICVSCGTSYEDRGFIDLIAEVNVKRLNESEIIGVIDVVLCGNCVEQAGQMVGMATEKENKQMVNLCTEFQTENEKLKDEIQAWQQRYNNLIEVISMTDLKEKNARSDTDPKPVKRPTRRNSGVPAELGNED